MSGYVTFLVEARELASPLGAIREVVRAAGIEPLSGARGPVTGVLELRGLPVPVVDLRGPADPGDRGDVLILETADGFVGVAVDRVLAVVSEEELVAVDAVVGGAFPAYVMQVRRHADRPGPVLVVSLPALASLPTGADLPR